MKIAILYGGRILDYDTYYDKLKKFIIKDNDVDIFLSHSKELNEDLTGFIDLYKPKIVIDENIDYNGPTPQHYNGMCMFYNRYRIFQAFKKYCQEHGIHYDRIMVYRLDVLALSEIDFNTMDLIDDNSIYVPNIAHCKGINDFMAIGNFNAIEKYCNLMLHYEETLAQCYVKDSNELILKVYLDTIKMKINYFPYNCLLREDIRLNGGRNIRISKEDLKNLLKNDIKF
jgi:hypothetical protein